MPSIKDCFIFTPNNGTIVELACTAIDKSGKDTYTGTVKCTRANAHDLATAKGNGKFISYHYDEVSILILAIVIVLIIREKRAEDLIMIWITAEDVIAIHSKIVQIVGGIDGIRDCAGLEAAIADRSVKEAGLLDWITYICN